MTSLLETFKLTFLSNIIKNKYVGKTQPVRLGRKEGDALMKQLVNDVFKKLLDEKKEITFELTQYFNRDILPITTNFVAKFSKNNDVLFNRISLIRLISVCNLFLQDNNVASTLKRVQKKEDDEPDHAMIELLQNMQISRGNQDVVEAIEKQRISNTEQLNYLNSGLVAAIKTASAERKKEAADLKEDFKKYIEEMKSQTSSKRLENGDEVFDDKTSDELSAKEKATREDETLEYSQKVKDENKVKKQFDNNVDTVKFNKGQYIITLTDKSELFYSITKFDGLNQEDQSYLEKKITIDNDLQLTITKKLKKVEELIEKLIALREAPSIDMKKALEVVEASNKILDDLEYIHPKRSEIRSKRIKLLNEQRELKRNQKQIKMIRPKDNEEKVAEYYSFDEYSDDFEAASNDMSIEDETHFLKVIFNTLKNPGVDHVTNSLIDYLESGLQMNKGEYKRSYKQFYNTWQFEDDVVMDRDKEVVKTLFSNINEIDFDDDYLCIMGGDTKLSWISYMRIAVYEKYILMDYIENFNGYDIRGCMREALSNFIYDYCYMSTLMFETVAE